MSDAKNENIDIRDQVMEELIRLSEADLIVSENMIAANNVVNENTKSAS